MGRPSHKGKVCRLNLEINQDTHDRMLWLRDDTGAASITETVRRALQLYEVIRKAQNGGESFLIEDADGNVREFVLL